jgi:hypothetical protein
METSALPTLRPLRLGELLDQAIRLYRQNFLPFVGIIALVYVPLTVLQTAASTLMTSSMLEGVSSPEALFSNAAYWIGLLSVLLLSFAQFIFVQGIATGALTRAVADNYLGKKTGILDAYRGIGKSWPSLLGALLFLSLVVFVAVLWWIIVPCIGWFTGLGMLVFLTGAINPLVAPAVVLEGQGAIDAVRRAWSLVRRRFWPVLGYIFVLYLLSLLIIIGPATIANFLLTQVFVSLNDPTMQHVLTSIIGSLVRLVGILIYYPLQMTAFTLIYFDLRVRTEGFDIALLTMGTSESTDITQAVAAPVPQSTERLITGQDLGNFAILTLAATGIYIFFFSFIMGSAFFLTSFLR